MYVSPFIRLNPPYQLDILSSYVTLATYYRRVAGTENIRKLQKRSFFLRTPAPEPEMVNLK